MKFRYVALLLVAIIATLLLTPAFARADFPPQWPETALDLQYDIENHSTGWIARYQYWRDMVDDAYDYQLSCHANGVDWHDTLEGWANWMADEVALSGVTITSEFYDAYSQALFYLGTPFGMESALNAVAQALSILQDNLYWSDLALTGGNWDPAAARYLWLAMVQVDNADALLTAAFQYCDQAECECNTMFDCYACEACGNFAPGGCSSCEGEGEEEEE